MGTSEAVPRARLMNWYSAVYTHPAVQIYKFLTTYPYVIELFARGSRPFS